jgi:RNase P subunit RPR2
MKKELLNGLTEEQISKVKACKNSDDLLALAKAEGVELSDEQLAAVNGGNCFGSVEIICPECKSKNVDTVDLNSPMRSYVSCTCRDCGHHWLA